MVKTTMLVPCWKTLENFPYTSLLAATCQNLCSYLNLTRCFIWIKICKSAPHGEVESLNGISWGFRVSGASATWAFEAPKCVMDVCLEHTIFSRMSDWTHISRRCVGRSVARIWAKRSGESPQGPQSSSSSISLLHTSGEAMQSSLQPAPRGHPWSWEIVLLGGWLSKKPEATDVEELIFWKFPCKQRMLKPTF